MMHPYLQDQEVQRFNHGLFPFYKFSNFNRHCLSNHWNCKSYFFSSHHNKKPPPSPDSLLGMGINIHGNPAFFLTELYTTSSIPIAIGLWILATLYTSLFYLLAGGIIVTLNKQFPISTKFHIPIAFGIIELLKGIGPYANPLGNIGYTVLCIRMDTKLQYHWGIRYWSCYYRHQYINLKYLNKK